LVQSVYQQGGSEVVYLPGSRTALFDGEGVSLTPADRKGLTNNLWSWDRSPDTRWRNVSGNRRNEKAIHDLTAAESQYKNDLANFISNGLDVEKHISALQAKVSPLDRVNGLLEEANIPLQMALLDGELKAQANGNSFSFARMSDGERTALILIAEVIAAKDATVFLIDEPELHLHKSIVVPLIAGLIKSRPNCEFVVSTHELELPVGVPSARVCIVRGIRWTPEGAVTDWDVDVVEDADQLPEDLRTDILGSRRKVLFTEGTDQSLDVPMYSVLFPNVSVRSKGGCRAVQQAVAGIRSTNALHHTTGYGLIDNDGMSPQQIADHQADGVYALPVFSVESLYYDPDVVRAVAVRQAATLAADEDQQQSLVAACLSQATTDVLAAASANGAAEHLAGRIAERQVRDAIVSTLPNRNDLISASPPTITLSTQSPYPAELARLHAMIAAGDAFGIIGRYPVRHSGILAAVAGALKFANRSDYEAAALARVSSDATLRNVLIAKLNPLSAALSN
jgi:hypothetical protein